MAAIDMYEKTLDLFDQLPQTIRGVSHWVGDLLVSKCPYRPAQSLIGFSNKIIDRVFDPTVFRYMAAAAISTFVGYEIGVGTIELVQSLNMNPVAASFLSGYGGYITGFLAGTIITKPLLLYLLNPQLYWGEGVRRGRFIMDQIKIIGMSGATQIVSAIIFPPIQSFVLLCGSSPEMGQLVGSFGPVLFKVLTQSQVYRKII